MLGELFSGLSANTRYLRFFGPLAPGAALLRTLAGCADNVDRPGRGRAARRSSDTPWPWTGPTTGVSG